MGSSPDERTIVGRLYAAGTSGSSDATLRVGTDGARGVVSSPAGSKPVRIEEVSDRLGGVERRIEFDDGSTFATRDDEAVDRLVAPRGGWFSSFSRVSRAEAWHPRLALFVVGAIAALFFLVRDGVPLAAKGAAWATPPAVSTAIDRSARSSLDRFFLSPSELPDERKRALDARFAELAGDGEQLELHFRKGGRLGPNALALPGGTIIVTDELAKLLDDDEITAVLAHEIAHVREQHSLQSLYRAGGIALLAALVIGDPGPVLEDMVAGGSIAIAMGSSRAMETEADARAVEILADKGYDPTRLGTGLEKLISSVCPGKGKCDETGWLSSHPGRAERLEDLKREVEALKR